MSADAVMQLLVLAAEAVAVCSLLLVFFSLRARYGFAPLYVTLGGFQHLQTLMAATLYIEVFPGIAISPGSAVLFTATLCTARDLPGAEGTTYTAGIANYPNDGDTVEELIARADQRLYKGKERGRNRVMYDTVIMKALTTS